MSRARSGSRLGGFARLAVIAAVTALVCGCSGLRYYAQAVRGQGALIVHRQPLRKLLREPDLDPKLAERLKLAQRARHFASTALALPDNRSYTGYVDLERPYVVWNVFAAPAFSVEAVPQCFPLVGCVAYRGWFKQADAEADAARLAARGNDVWIGGVPAYSTLGWFADPILSSMLRGDDDALASTIFHELAHQLVYVKDDTAFNESFATFVQTQGLRQWRVSRQLPPLDDHRRAMDDGFVSLVLALRQRLGRLYASGVDASAMSVGKRQQIADFRARYAAWREREWPGEHRYDAWVAQPINNARLLPFGLYDQWTPAFARLFRQAGSRWPAFYRAVRALAQQSKTMRDRRLKGLLANPEHDAAPVP